MVLDDVRKLQSGDEVNWTDPDAGLCSRTLTIQSISVEDEEEGAVCIVDKDGSLLECFARELS